MTQDLLLSVMPFLAADARAGVLAGFHIRTSHSLTYIVANPGDVSQATPSAWNVALPGNSWNTVSGEPYPDASTIGSETSAFLSLVSAAASGPSVAPRYYLYEAWPSTDSIGSNYQAYWNGQVVDADSTPFTLRLAAENAVYARLQATLGRNIYVIPVGDVLDAVDIAARAGQLPGITSVNDLYRDVNHLGDVGHYAAAVTYLDTVLHRQVRGSPATLTRYKIGDGAVPLTQVLATDMENIAWTVVSTDSRVFH